MSAKKNSKIKAEKSEPPCNSKNIEEQEITEKTPKPQETAETTDIRFPVVGIGASAGGLAAFEAFFSGMPTSDTDGFGKLAAGPGMAFVLVQHLAPDHKSILADIIRRYTRMQVFEVEDGMVVQPNCAYIIPPNRDMAFLNGTLHLMEPSSPRGQRLPIDFFFRSLAQDQHERAIGIVLSGTGSDGTLGLRAIKGEGGMAMVQIPESTEYDGMPRSAISTGLVDYELAPADMPTQLIAYALHAFGKGHSGAIPAPKTENALKKIFILLRNQTGHDFSQYKPSTINRRIERRMALEQIETFENYVKYLQQTPAEVEALFRDMLIGVTNFFRDPETFKVLEEQVIPKLFAGKPASAVIRIWVTGCSTGEEAYSIAILLAERQEAMKQTFKVQIFATDIDRQAIATARAGIYPASIVADVTPERLARFFTPDLTETNRHSNTYRINKGIRDMLVFSEQDIIKDPPFSRLDLISCRNLLIYMDGDLQKKLIPLFHYALNPEGILFLGTSETIGEFCNLFTSLDRKAKIYRKRDDLHGALRTGLGKFIPPMTAIEVTLPRENGRKSLPVKLQIRELTEQALLQQVAPSAVLVNNHGDILYLHGRTGMYLEPAPGEAGINIVKMAREGLRYELATALQKAVSSKEIVRIPGLQVKTNGHFTTVNLTVRPVITGPGATPETPLFLVVFEEAPSDKSDKSDKSEKSDGSDSRILALQQELRTKGEYIQVAYEELETSTEELKSSNEEMQSVNEELQSTNEELETSKEELQSVNEELATVNNELQTKVTDLSNANNDMNNLLAGTGIGTIFVDHQLRIIRFTPAVTKFINLIPGDLGRHVGHILPNLVGYTNLAADTKAVLDTLAPKEVEVQVAEGRWYIMRILPYRTLDNVIRGAVITFVEITEMKAMRRLTVVVLDAHDAITVQDLDGRIIAWNPGATRIYGWSEAEALKMNVRDRIPKNLREDAMDKLLQLSRAEILEPYCTQRLAKNGTVKDVSIVSTALSDKTGKMYAIATTEREVGKKV